MSTWSKTTMLSLAACLLTLGGSGASLAEPVAPARVEIVMDDFSYAPKDLRLKADQPVTLQFVNRGTGGHNFVSREFFAAAQMAEPTRTMLGRKGEVELDKGASVEVSLVPKAGTYKVKCTHFLHAGFGMTGTVTVE
jgi:plastocyanin